MKPNQNQPRRTRSSVGTGTTSLLMIFTVLCFATLGMLTLSTAASNARIQQRSFEGTAALAAAEGKAAEAVARLEAALATAAQGDALAEAATPLGFTETEEPGVWQLVTEVEQDHQLITQVQAKQNGAVQVVGQTTQYTGAWTPGQNGQLWPGN